MQKSAFILLLFIPFLFHELKELNKKEVKKNYYVILTFVLVSIFLNILVFSNIIKIGPFELLYNYFDDFFNRVIEWLKRE